MPEGLEQWRANSGSRLTAADELVVSSAREIIRSVVDIDEAKKAERQRRFDAAQLQAILNVLPAYTWYAAPSGALTFVNKRTGDYLGVPDDHPLRFGIDVGARWDDWVPLLHPDDRERARTYWSSCLRSGAPAEHSYRVRGAQGDYRWFLTRAEPLRASDGTLMAWVGATLDIEELKRAEQAVRESEYKLRQIIETVPAFIWSTGLEGEPTHVNQRLLDYSGMRLEEFRHRGWEAFVHPDDLPETEKAYVHAIQTGASYQGVMRLRRADGEFRWHQACCEPLRDRLGRPVHWYGVTVDIEAGKKAEDRLRRSEAHLAEAQRLSHTGSWAYNATDILYWSEQSYRIWGFDPLQGPPKREAVRQRVHPDDRDRAEEAIQSALDRKTDYAVEFRIVLPDGAVKYLEAIGHPLFSAGGELVEVVGTNVDVTQRKRDEQALRESEARFRDYAETASDWFWEVDPDYKFTLLTENAFDSGAADRIGTACWDHALDLETEPEKWRIMRATLDARKPFRDFVYCSASSTGSPIHVRASGRPMFGADGEFRGYRGTGADVTAIVRAQEEHERLRELESHLARMNRVSVMGELTASLVHEITQPIASARNNARAAMNFLERHPRDVGKVEESLACLVGDIDRTGKIIDGLRGHIKKAPPRRDRFGLNEAIKEVIVLARSAIIKNGVAVHTRLAPGPVMVEGDRVQVQQVALNLILNATEAMSSVAAGSRDLSISTEQGESDTVLVAVRDSGPGIARKDIERIFQTFYTTKSSGTGMGLAISRSIVAAHGGRLWADVNAPRGAVFRFTLPNRAKDPTDFLPTIPRAEAPHEGVAADAPRQPALEGGTQGSSESFMT
jgi:PAS domain S-box-containing protein